ncbi:PP73 [Orf virus]|uniref:PP73 n=1 Tax=Orf virus TaxID=10258 RepID=F1AX66_ORFV|nr:PP73 [Orf virus]
MVFLLKSGDWKGTPVPPRGYGSMPHTHTRLSASGFASCAKKRSGSGLVASRSSQGATASYSSTSVSMTGSQSGWYSTRYGRCCSAATGSAPGAFAGVAISGRPNTTSPYQRRQNLFIFGSLAQLRAEPAHCERAQHGRVLAEPRPRRRARRRH